VAGLNRLMCLVFILSVFDCITVVFSMLVSLHGALYPCFINRLAHSGGIYCMVNTLLEVNFLFLTVTQSRIVPAEKQDEQ
jgi:hypothetical protein